MLHLSNKVLHCDPEAGSLTLSDGQVVQSDLIIGADGISVGDPFQLDISLPLRDTSSSPSCARMSWATSRRPKARAAPATAR